MMQRASLTLQIGVRGRPQVGVRIGHIRASATPTRSVSEATITQAIPSIEVTAIPSQVAPSCKLVMSVHVISR
jgi:hypothetical protein